MADYIVKDTELTSVANAIRTAGGTNSLLNFPNGFVSAVNNISGGGGSSDFSTANVTLTIEAGKAQLLLPLITDIPSGALSIVSNPPVPTMIVNMPLYKGILNIVPISVTGTVSTSGACEYTNDQFIITGDCTITIS